MHRLYTTTALTLMFGLATTVSAADPDTEQQSGAPQTAQAQQQQPKLQTSQQQAGQSQQSQQQTAQGRSGQQGQEQQMQALRSIDTDDDGRVSPEEAEAHGQRAFSALD